jgi:hypothetical protein
MRFAKAVQEAVAAAPFSAAAEDPASLLETRPALLACEPAAADFWTVSNAAAQQTQGVAALQPQQQRGKRLRPYNERLPAEANAVSAVFGVEQLVHPKRQRLQSRAVMQLRAGVAAVEAQRQVKVEQVPAKGGEGGEGCAACLVCSGWYGCLGTCGACTVVVCTGGRGSCQGRRWR